MQWIALLLPGTYYQLFLKFCFLREIGSGGVSVQLTAIYKCTVNKSQSSANGIFSQYRECDVR